MQPVTAPLIRLLFDAGIACAGGEARRYISSGIIAVDGVIVRDVDAVVPVGAALSVVKSAKVCPTCRGSGQRVGYHQITHDDPDRDYSCLVCLGAGKVAA